MRSVALRRTMKAAEVKEAILDAFKSLHISSFIVLDAIDSGHTLVRSEKQEIDGEYAINRRGSLYLCEKLEVSSAHYVRTYGI